MPATKKAPAKKKVVKKEEAKGATKSAPEAGLKLRIKLKAYDHKIIDNSARQIIDILNPNQEIIESLRDLNLPSGVDITIKI